MDWEKKTAQRDPLQRAAADTFNDVLTPGQSLLQALQVGSAMQHAPMQHAPMQPLLRSLYHADTSMSSLMLVFHHAKLAMHLARCFRCHVHSMHKGLPISCKNSAEPCLFIYDSISVDSRHAWGSDQQCK